MKKENILLKIKEYNNKNILPGKSSAVIIPLLEIEGDMHILFEERSHKLSFQPGDICFPGGRIEEGETPLDAAKRELVEEIFCKKRFSESVITTGETTGNNDISCIDDILEILCELPPMLGPSGFPVYPFVALIKNRDFSYSPEEVERLLTYSIDFLKEHPPVCYPMERKTIAPDNFPYEKITGGKATYNWHVHHYNMWVYEDTDPVIWGFTGRLLHEFLDLV